ncbi:MAG: transporter [Elusimicrobia bacterium]|nr:transporter [Elusimicrobiota bacterium]
MNSRRLLLSLLVAIPALSFAGPPFVTDDPEPVPLHHWEIYSAAAGAETKDGWSGAAPAFDINYGALHNVHLHALVQAAGSHPFHGNRNYGFGDLEVGAKIRFVDETARRPQMAIYPAVDFPTGDEHRDLGAGRAQAFLPLWIQKSGQKWSTYGGGGYWMNPGAGRKNWIYLGWTLQYNVAKHVMAGAELFHRTADTVDASSSDGFNVGGAFDLSPEYHLLLSAGRDLNGPNRFTSYLALQWTYPGE